MRPEIADAVGLHPSRVQHLDFGLTIVRGEQCWVDGVSLRPACGCTVNFKSDIPDGLSRLASDRIEDRTAHLAWMAAWKLRYHAEECHQ